MPNFDSHCFGQPYYSYYLGDNLFTYHHHNNHVVSIKWSLTGKLLTIN